MAHTVETPTGLVGAGQVVTERPTMPTSRRDALLALAVAAAALVLGLVLQLWSGADGRTYGDISPLFDSRGIRPDELPYLDRPLEYPVVIGYVMWALSWVADTATAFLVANAVLLGTLGIATTVALQRRTGSRALAFAAAPTLVLYSMHNWDLIPVAASVIGLLALERGRPATAGAVLAVGAWAKLYPGLILAVLAVVLWRRGDRRSARRMVAAAAVASVALNLPVLLTTWDGWWHAARFQGDRTATWGSLWFRFIRLPGLERLELDSASVANRASVVLLCLGLLFVLWRATRRHLDLTSIALAVTVVFILTNKVFSPQYTLWIVPFFALLPVARWCWAALMAVDVVMYAVVFGDFYGGEKLSPEVRADWVAWIVLVRAAVLLAILHQSLRTRPARV